MHEHKVDFIKKEQLCFGCLEKGHVTKYCKARSQCKDCKKNHPTSLHNDNYNTNHIEQQQHLEENNNQSCRATKVKNGRTNKVLCAVIPVKIRSTDNQREIITYASLDTCSSSCFMNQNLLDDLGIKARDSNVSISTIENDNKSIGTKVVSNLQIAGLHDVYYKHVPVVYAQKNWPFSVDNVPQPEDIDELEDIPFDFVNAKVGLIIGMNHPDIVKPRQIIDNPQTGIYASLHSIGWALNGPVGKTDKVISNRVKINGKTSIHDIPYMYEKDYSDTNMTSKQYSI